MIEVKIPKEINKYKPKLIGPLTFRQFVSAIVFLPLCVVIFLGVKPYVGQDLAGFFVIIPGGLMYLFGWRDFYGMPFEKFLKSTFISNVLAPTKRKWKTENFYSDIYDEILKEEELEKNSGKKVKKKKYKKDKRAIK